MAIGDLRLSWTPFLAYKTDASNGDPQIYERVDTQSGDYTLWMVTSLSTYEVVLRTGSAEHTTYTGTYQTPWSSIAAESRDHAISLESQAASLAATEQAGTGDHPKVPLIPGDLVFQFAEVSVSTQTETTVVSYQVPASPSAKVLQLLFYQGFRSDASGKEAVVTLKVGGSTRHKVFSQATDTKGLIFGPPVPMPFGDPGELIEITVTRTTSGGSGNFSGTIYGFLQEPIT